MICHSPTGDVKLGFQVPTMLSHVERVCCRFWCRWVLVVVWVLVMAMVYQRTSVEARLWQQMSFELVERVLSFLGAPDLCRCRAVCRRWDYLICTLRFGALCRENARGHPGYIVARVVEDTGGFYSESDGSEEEEEEDYTRFGWSILDVRLRLAADEGLVCEFRVFFELVVSLTVFNPLTKTTVALPFPPKHPGAKLKNGTLNFVVDETDNNFKIFFIHQCMMRMAPAGGSEGPEEIKRHDVMHIYESATGQWRSTTNPPLPKGQLGIGPFGSNVMFQGYCDLWYATNAMNLRVPTGRRKKLKMRKSNKKTWNETLSQSRKANGSGLPSQWIPQLIPPAGYTVCTCRKKISKGDRYNYRVQKWMG
ncbi:hypothetical protein KC19_6G183400 [Ceratodon purpureus]|uniref:F-box domain-containing protein n=1 Tax=Ceratodon purpureus TaxID=3225 RepID=A0A8T0HI89_CERPU|nr:hypothetical protein KC19_6G183400 [Ceratodon purpureus]